MELEDYVIRKAAIEDCGVLHKLIQELADYEQDPTGPKISVKILERDGFGSRPAFGCFVAAVKESNEVIGYAMHFNTYSAWEGKGLYLQDIYVQPLHRKKSIGLAFFRLLSKLGVEEDCSMVNFTCLHWNQPSINFYQSLGAYNLTEKAGRHCFRLERQFMDKLAQLGTSSERSENDG